MSDAHEGAAERDVRARFYLTISSSSPSHRPPLHAIHGGRPGSWLPAHRSLHVSSLLQYLEQISRREIVGVEASTREIELRSTPAELSEAIATAVPAALQGAVAAVAWAVAGAGVVRVRTCVHDGQIGPCGVRV